MSYKNRRMADDSDIVVQDDRTKYESLILADQSDMV